MFILFTAKDSEDTIPGVATDISIGGMFVQTSQTAPFGAKVTVSFAPSGKRGLIVSGTVRWTNGSGMGIQFGLLGAQETHEITEIQREHGTFTGVR